MRRICFFLSFIVDENIENIFFFFWVVRGRCSSLRPMVVSWTLLQTIMPKLSATKWPRSRTSVDYYGLCPIVSIIMAPAADRQEHSRSDFS